MTDDFVIVPRLEEYYRPRSKLAGWGQKGLAEWRKPGAGRILHSERNPA